MDFDPSVFFGAFKQAGMLVSASYQPSVGPLIEFDVGFTRPDQIVLDGVVHSTDYTIEYQRADVTLKRDYLVTVDGGHYKVRQTPVAKGDGTFMRALLETV